MSDTPETDAQLTSFLSISKLGKHFTNRTGTVSAEFARRLERERNEARMELARWAGIMHDPNKPLKLEPLVWKSNGGDSVPETWRDAYEDLEKEYAKATGYWASLQNWLNMVHESFKGQDRDGLNQLYMRGPFAGWSQEKMVRMADELWENSQKYPFHPKKEAHNE